MSRSPIQIVEWFCTQADYWHYQELRKMAADLPEDSDELNDVIEQFKSLPNFPTGYDPEHAHIIPRPTSTQFN